MVCFLQPAQNRRGESAVGFTASAPVWWQPASLCSFVLSVSYDELSDKTEFWMLWPPKGVTYVITHNTRDLY